MAQPLHQALRQKLPTTPRLIALAAGTAGLALLSGCNVDSFFDQSTLGRWERTATSAPILERLTTIEDESGQYVELTDVTSEDLIPAPKEYRISAGDFLTVAMFDVIRTGAVEPVQVQVDTRGVINLPIVGQVAVGGRTAEQANDLVKEAMRPFVSQNPISTVEVVQQRQQTFTVLGAVGQPGPYFIPTAEYRLLEALTASGQFNDSIEELYIIRQVPLSDQLQVNPPAARPADVPAATPTTTPSIPSSQPEEKQPIIDLIDELSKPAGDPSRPPADAPTQPEPGQPAPPIDLPPPGEPKEPGSPAVMGSGVERRTRPVLRRDEPPPVDLVDSARAPAPASQPATTPATGEGTTWMFLDGKWVSVGRRGAAAPAGSSRPGDDMVTQRVIRVPLKPLLAGDSKYNIIVRPGDIIRVPPPLSGNIYIAGQVNRPGVYNLPFEGRLTLLRLVDAAGGLGALGVPERVELTRMTGKNRQATISLDLRAIAEMTQPDIYLKPDDRINVGTNFWAYPVAVLRSGFRATYGFGFVLDRNFEDEIFGPRQQNFF